MSLAPSQRMDMLMATAAPLRPSLYPSHRAHGCVRADDITLPPLVFFPIACLSHDRCVVLGPSEQAVVAAAFSLTSFHGNMASMRLFTSWLDRVKKELEDGTATISESGLNTVFIQLVKVCSLPPLRFSVVASVGSPARCSCALSDINHFVRLLVSFVLQLCACPQIHSRPCIEHMPDLVASYLRRRRLASTQRRAAARSPTCAAWGRCV